MYKYVNAVTHSDCPLNISSRSTVPGQAPGCSLYAGRATGSRNWNGNLDHSGFPAYPRHAHCWCGLEVELPPNFRLGQCCYTYDIQPYT